MRVIFNESHSETTLTTYKKCIKRFRSEMKRKSFTLRCMNAHVVT